MVSCIALCLSPAKAEESTAAAGDSPPHPPDTIPIITSEGIPGTQKINYRERPEDTLFIVALTAGDAVLDKNLLIYINDEEILVPLSAFCKAVQFPIDVDVGKGQAQGWFRVRFQYDWNEWFHFLRIGIFGTGERNAWAHSHQRHGGAADADFLRDVQNDDEYDRDQRCHQSHRNALLRCAWHIECFQHRNIL